MKTERRHELQTNKLADWTGHQLEHIRPHGKLVLGVAILGAAVVITAIVLIKDSQAAQSRAWNDYYLALGARDRDALASVAKTHDGTDVALWALQSQADIDLASGIAALYTNRDDAFRSLNDARDAYTAVLQHGGLEEGLRRHCMLGLAQAHEGSSNLDKARQHYREVVGQFPGTPEAQQAAARLSELENPQVEKFYSWFARQKPSLGPPSSLPGMPDDLTDLPDRPDGPLLPLPSSSPSQPDQGSAPVSPTPEASGSPGPSSSQPPSGTDSAAPQESAGSPPK